MSAINNVASLNQQTVFEDIQTFIRSLKMNSDNTAKSYEKSIRRFFFFMRNKEIENIVPSDLEFRNVDMLKYQLHLKEIPLSNASVNNSIFAVVSLYSFLEKNGYNVRSKIISVDSLPITGENYGTLTVEQAERMAELVLNEVKGVEKSALWKLAFKTSIRESALLSLTWDNIKKVEDKDFYIVEVIDKGNKKDCKPISLEMYSDLLKIKQQKYYQKYTDNKIFHLSITTICDTMSRLREIMKLDDNIKFHSLKNVGINWTYEQTGSIVAAARQGNHSSIQTTYNHYMKKDTDYENMAGILLDQKVDFDIFKKLDKEELLKLIYSMPKNIQLMILNKIENKGVDLD